MVAIVPDGGASPLGPSWQAVLTHISDRLSWVDPAFGLQVLQTLAPSPESILPPSTSTTTVALSHRNSCYIGSAFFSNQTLHLLSPH